MAAKRYDEERVGEILEAIDAGAKIAQVCRDYQVSRTTIHRWQKKRRAANGQEGPQDELIGMLRIGEGSEAKPGCLKELETENARLKRIVIRQALHIEALQELVTLERGC